MTVYLPKGAQWKKLPLPTAAAAAADDADDDGASSSSSSSSTIHDGGEQVEVDCPLQTVPVFIRV